MSLVVCFHWDVTPTCEFFPELSEQSYTVIEPDYQLIACSNLPSVEDYERVSQELAAGILTPGGHPQQQASLRIEVNERLTYVKALCGDGRVNPCDYQCPCGTLRTRVDSLNRQYSDLVTRVVHLARISLDSAHLDFQIQESLCPVEEHLKTIDRLLFENTSQIASLETLCTPIDGYLLEIEMLQECLDAFLSHLEQKNFDLASSNPTDSPPLPDSIADRISLLEDHLSNLESLDVWI